MQAARVANLHSCHNQLTTKVKAFARLMCSVIYGVKPGIDLPRMQELIPRTPKVDPKLLALL
jgi:hypothetical protein